MKRPFVSAVIAAAGSSTRIGGYDKQLIVVDRLPVIARTVTAFDRAPEIDEIVVVTRSQLLEDMTVKLKEYGFSKLKAVVAGGTTRQDSVFAGIRACSDDAEYYAVHDGARPLVTGKLIADVIDAAVCHGAAAPGLPITDTVKQVDENGLVETTVPRSMLRSIQTPQVIRGDIYEKGMRLSSEKGISFTDDCQLAEMSGTPVFICPGEEWNLKITTPRDLLLYERWFHELEERKKKGN